MDTSSNPLVSVIATGYTSARLDDINELLKSTRQQTLEGIEVVFVGERDPQICERVTSMAAALGLKSFTAAFNTGTPGLSGARNVGVALAKGRFLAFIDDDAVLFPDWAERLVAAFDRDPSIVGLTGAAIPSWEDASMAWIPEEFYWLFSCTGWLDVEAGAPIRNAWGVNMAFRREVFAHAEFDDRFGGNMGASDGTKLGMEGEDTIFSLRIRKATGGVIIYDPAVKVRHKVHRYRATPRYIKRRAFWSGYTRAVLRREWRASMDHMVHEKRLMKRILCRFLPSALAQVVRRPALGMRQLSFAAGILFYVALGYASHDAPHLGRLTCPLFQR